MAAGATGERSFQETPTWAVAVVCAVFVIISLLIEHGIHSLGKGKAPLISQIAVHQLHIFIFVLAVFHILYSVITMALGQAKMKKWKAWESETESLEYQFTNDPARFRFTHQTSFLRRHSGLSRTPGIKWIAAFCRQFFGSLSKVDYLTMRRGFINAHVAPNSKFNFHKHIKRSLEDDFKVVVGISIPLWIFAVIFLLLNVYEWYSLTWLALAPLVIILLVGTKLELIIMEMAQEIQDRTAVVKGAPVVEPSNKYFWFNRLQWILYLIHFTSFQNAFHMSYFLWTYMGSHMKQAIFEEQTAKALKKWHKAVKDKKKLRKGGEDSSSGFMSGENTPSQGTSPIHLLHKHQSNKSDFEADLYSPKSYHSDTDLSEIEGSTPDRHASRTEGQTARTEESHNIDFTFVKA